MIRQVVKYKGLFLLDLAAAIQENDYIKNKILSMPVAQGNQPIDSIFLCLH